MIRNPSESNRQSRLSPSLLNSRLGIRGLCLLFLLVLCLVPSLASDSVEQDWTHFVRIGAYGLKSDNAVAIVENAQRDGVFGIEVDNDIEGRYESFLDPAAKLRAIQAVAEKAHAVGNHAFVYIAGTECITANADKTAHTLAKDHPDWLQRKITGEPAIFGGGTAFWIKKGDEDVWVSPYAPEWRKIYMERVKQIAGTGIDGIYVDIPYWMTHFEGWENTWASFDDYTVAAFRKQTGLDAKKDLKLGDFGDPNFRKWVDFRIQTFTDFMQEIGQNAKSVNPEIKVIPEIYPGIEEAAVRVGADVYSLYSVVDAVAHEYEYGEGDHMASSRNPLDWFSYQVGMHSFRAFAQGKATWILNYSWDGDKKVASQEPMKNLAMSQVMAGANFWDAPGHSMAGSNDYPTRREIFSWIKAHENTFYRPRTPISPIGVYFSPQTRNYFADEFIASYRGILILLMQKHLEFQVVTPRTLAEFPGKTLVLPDVRVLNDTEKTWLRKYVDGGRTLVITGEDATELGGSDSRGRLSPQNPGSEAPGVASGNPQNIVRFGKCPGAEYFAALKKSFDTAAPEQEQAFLDALKPSSSVRVSASAAIATSIARVEGEPHVFFANFAGLRGGVNPVQIPQSGVRVEVAGDTKIRGFFLSFLGEVSSVEGVAGNGVVTFTLPAIEKGAVFWWKP
jgi:Glycosyl hydrolase-like 10